MASIPAKRQRTEDGPLPVVDHAPPATSAATSGLPWQHADVAGFSSSSASSDGTPENAPPQPQHHPVNPHFIISRLDPQRSTPAALYDVLVHAALHHPDVASHLYWLAFPHPSGLVPAPASVVQHQYGVLPPPVPGASYAAVPSPMRTPGLVTATTDRVLAPLAQAPAPIPQADSSTSPHLQPSVPKKPTTKKRATKTAPAPKDKNFNKELKQALTALDSNRGPMAVQDKLEDMSAAIAKEVTPHASWATKYNAVTALRQLVLDIIMTPGPIGRQMRNHGLYDFEVNFTKAVESLSEEERLRLGTESGGVWLQDFAILRSEAGHYGGLMERTLNKIAEMVTPKPGAPSGEAVVAV